MTDLGLNVKIKTTGGTEMEYLANSGLSQKPMVGDPETMSADYYQRLQSIIDIARAWFTADSNLQTIEIERE